MEATCGNGYAPVRGMPAMMMMNSIAEHATVSYLPICYIVFFTNLLILELSIIIHHSEIEEKHK